MRLAAKDYVTLGNVLSGLACAVLAMSGYEGLGALMLLGALVCDLGDGLVARLTGQQNRFGGELDNVADHMSYGVAPSFVLFAAYRPVFAGELGLGQCWGATCAFIVAAVPLLFSSVRFARFNTFHYDVEGYWLGFPRPASGFALVALVHSHLFEAGIVARLLCIGLVLAFALLNVSTIPYLNAKGGRRSAWAFFAVFIGGGLVTLVAGPLLGLISGAWLADVTFFCMGIYGFFGWLIVPEKDRAAVRSAVEAAQAA
jgi:phosphatidylserine synthase